MLFCVFFCLVELISCASNNISEDQTEPEPSAQNTETDDHDDDHRSKDQAHLQVALVNVILIHSGFPLHRRSGGLFC